MRKIPSHSPRLERQFENKAKEVGSSLQQNGNPYGQHAIMSKRHPLLRDAEDREERGCITPTLRQEARVLECRLETLVKRQLNGVEHSLGISCA